MKPMVRERKREQGAVAILTAILIVVLIGFAAIVVDVGFMFRVRNELQNAADSAALAGAQMLDGTDDGIDNARQAVNDWALKHKANNTDVAIEAPDILFGHWHFRDGSLCNDGDTSPPCFQSYGTAPSSDIVDSVNAVKVVSRRTQATSNQLNLFFAPVIGHGTANVTAAAVAIGGGPAEEDCAFPMVVPDCVLEDATDPSGTCDYCMRFQDNNSDNAGWTSFDENAVSGPMINTIIQSACCVNGQVAIDETTGKCLGACHGQSSTSIEQEIKVQNGNLLNSGGNCMEQGTCCTSGNSFCETIKFILRRGDPNAVPQPFTVRVPVLQSTDDQCNASQFSSYKEIAGYATMVIYGAKCGNGDKSPAYVSTAPSCSDYKNPGTWPPSSDKWVIGELKCGLDVAEPAGGGNFGLDALRVRLVN